VTLRLCGELIGASRRSNAFASFANPLRPPR
jgi:hypothetical protein